MKIVGFLCLLGITITFWNETNEVKYSDSETFISFKIDDIDSVFSTEGFLSILSQKKVIGLGDASHGTHEFFEIKIAIMKQLILNGEVNIVGMENGFGACLGINKYIRQGEGDLNEILLDNYWWMNCMEIIEFIEWLKVYNSFHEKKISLLGFDNYSKTDFEASKNFVIEFLSIIDTNISGRLTYSLKKLTFKNCSNYEKGKLKISFFDDVHSDLLKALGILSAKRNEVDNNSKDYNQNLCILSVENMIRTITNVKELRANINKKTNYIIYDKGRFIMIKRMLELFGDDSKIVCWAANAHIQKGAQYSANKGRTFKVNDSFNGFVYDRRMGYFLDSFYKDKYYCIAFEFGSGGFKAFSLKIIKLKKDIVVQSDPGTLGTYLREKYNGSNLFIDFKSTNARMFYEPQIVSNIPGAYWNRYAKLIPSENYDAIIYVDSTRGIIMSQYFYKHFKLFD